MLWEHETVGSSPAIPTINLIFMETKLRFFKRDKKWYADVPNHTLEENEMIMGSDTALDLMSDNKDEIVLTLSDEDDERSILTMTMKEHDSEGAYYILSGFLYNKFLDLFALDSSTLPSDITNEIWICNVTHDVFGSHPKNIYLLKIE